MHFAQLLIVSTFLTLSNLPELLHSVITEQNVLLVIVFAYLPPYTFLSMKLRDTNSSSPAAIYEQLNVRQLRCSNREATNDCPGLVMSHFSEPNYRRLIQKRPPILHIQ